MQRRQTAKARCPLFMRGTRVECKASMQLSSSRSCVEGHPVLSFYSGTHACQRCTLTCDACAAGGSHCMGWA